MAKTKSTTIDLRLGSFDEILSDVKADLIVTSPPYNIGSKSPKRITDRKNGGYDAKSYGSIEGYPDNMPEADYQDSQVAFLKWAYDHLTNDGVLVYNHKPRRMNNQLIHPMQWFMRVPELKLIEEVIWDRGSTHQHSVKMMWPHTERLYVFRKGKYPLNNRQGLNFRSDVWRIPPDTKNVHAAPFPEALARGIIQAWSSPGMTVCDPYSGSGTTAVACVQTGRNFVGSEKLGKYYSKSMKRINEEMSK